MLEYKRYVGIGLICISEVRCYRWWRAQVRLTVYAVLHAHCPVADCVRKYPPAILGSMLVTRRQSASAHTHAATGN